MSLETSCRSSDLRKPLSGFTLIELLVVIAIIAVLAAMLFPVFAQAREKARQTACLSHEKQLGEAVMMYTQDYDERLPWWEGSGTAYLPNGTPYASNFVTWIIPSTGATEGDPGHNLNADYTMKPYIRNTQMQFCPSQNVRNIAKPSVAPYYAWLNYAMNDWYWNKLTGSNINQNSAPTQLTDRPHKHPYDTSVWEYYTPAGCPLAWVDEPTDTLLIWEHYDRAVVCAEYFSDTFTYTNGVTDAGYNHWNGIHNGGMNFVFCDGHAKWLKNSQLHTYMFTYWQEQDEP